MWRRREEGLVVDKLLLVVRVEGEASGVVGERTKNDLKDAVKFEIEELVGQEWEVCEER